MTDLKLNPLLESGTLDLSVLIGAPDQFDLLTALKDAETVQLAVAFGHMSGWSMLAGPLTHSSASRIQILLGRAFFQTEPAVILALKALQDKGSAAFTFQVKLASDNS